MVIARALLDDVIAHAREEYDAECCGIIAYAEPTPTATTASARSACAARTNIHAAR